MPARGARSCSRSCTSSCSNACAATTPNRASRMRNSSRCWRCSRPAWSISTAGRAVDPARFEADAERELADALAAARRDSAAALSAGDYAAVLARLAQLQVTVDAFFEKVLVNADDPAVRANRLALLHQLKTHFSTIADIALL